MQQYYCYIHTYIILIVLTCNVNVHNSIERLKGLRIRRPKFGYMHFPTSKPIVRLAVDTHTEIHTPPFDEVYLLNFSAP